MHNLVIDIGNTNSKLAVFNQREMVLYKRFQFIDHAKLATLIEQYAIQNATVSSVNTDASELIVFLKGLVNYVPFSTAISAGIKNSYRSLATLGLDRWAKVIAAHQLFKGKNTMMIDAGTCITYDVLNSNSEYFGGSISLGINMRFKALNHYTERLPLIAWPNEDTNIPLGDETTNAIKNGVLQGVLNEVEGFIATENKKNIDLQIIITGGDADFLNKQLKNSIFASQIIQEPYLVLKGLNEVITLSYVQ
ncbi:MAG: type III pantothenate kinase [Flavobacteriales bacterium]|nr:MAG: type III pantothenate kinase [Flavobacteriales bacterium]